MKYSAKLLFAVLLVAGKVATSQCERQADVYYSFLQFLNIQEPQDSVLKEQFYKLHKLEEVILEDLTKNPSLNIIPIFDVDFTKKHGYLLEGLVNYSTASNDYNIQLLFQATCTGKLLAEAKISFQLYPSWDPVLVAKQAVTKLMSLINIEELEDKERDSKNYGLGGDIWGGKIMITMNKSMVKGEETQVQMKVVDCDGLSLTNKDISLQGTTGGIFTPANIKTNANGVALTRFRLTTEKTAIIKAKCETKNVWGCQDLYTGTEVIKGIGGHPLKIEISYKQNETKTIKRGTLPGVKIKGGEESEQTEMYHHAVLYHFPSAAALKEGFLVATAKENPYPASKTEHVNESGWFLYRKNIHAAEIRAGVGIEVHATEEGEEQAYSGNASTEHPSELFFYKGDGKTPPSFGWNVEYPASNNGIAFGGVGFAKGDDGVQWIVKKITDTKSPYKTEYLLKLKLDAAKEFKKGTKAMKDLFGFNLDEMANWVDPTDPKSNMAGASGSQMITVRILSPYAD